MLICLPNCSSDRLERKDRAHRPLILISEFEGGDKSTAPAWNRLEQKYRRRDFGSQWICRRHKSLRWNRIDHDTLVRAGTRPGQGVHFSS